MEQDVLKQVMTTAQTWLDGNYDAETQRKDSLDHRYIAKR